MSSPLRSPTDLALFVPAVVVALVGVGLWFAGSRLLGAAIFVLGFAGEVVVCARHDGGHRRRGEPVHALWGQEDKHKPRWPHR